MNYTSVGTKSFFLSVIGFIFLVSVLLPGQGNAAGKAAVLDQADQAGVHFALASFVYDIDQDLLSFKILVSTFVDCGPSKGDTAEFLVQIDGMTMTLTEVIGDYVMVWKKVKGAADELTGTWIYFDDGTDCNQLQVISLRPNNIAIVIGIDLN